MIGVIILNYNTAQDTLMCLNKILLLESNNIKFFVVDNCSTDNSVQTITSAIKSYTQVEFIRSKINGGYSYGNNLGIRAALDANCEYIAIINPDVCLLNGALSEMRRFLDGNEDVMLVGPHIVDKSGKYGQVASQNLSFLRYLLTRRPILVNIKEHLCFNGVPMGCCFLIRAKYFIQEGLLDENVFLYREEQILARKFIDKSYLSALHPQAKVIHNHSSSISKVGWGFSLYHMCISSAYVLRKYEKINGINFIAIFFYHSALYFTAKYLKRYVFNKHTYLDLMRAHWSIYIDKDH